MKGECCAHGHIGAVYMSLRNYKNAIQCYQLQLERAKELRDNSIEAEAFGNLGTAKIYNKYLAFLHFKIFVGLLVR